MEADCAINLPLAQVAGLLDNLRGLSRSATTQNRTTKTASYILKLVCFVSAQRHVNTNMILKHK